MIKNLNNIKRMYEVGISSDLIARIYNTTSRLIDILAVLNKWEKKNI